MPDHLPQIPSTPMTPQTAAMAFLACAAYISVSRGAVAAERGSR
jgi:hypothetical protein